MFTINGQDLTQATLSIDDAVEKVHDDRRKRQDYVLPISQMRMGVDNDGITVTVNGNDYKPTEHAMKQMATWMGVSHAVLRQYTNPVYHQNGKVKYERDEKDMELLLAMYKNGIRDNRIDPNKQFRFRTYTDGTLRAMLSERYAIIDNVWYLEQLKKTFKNIGGDEPRFVHWRGDADTLYGNLVLPDTAKNEPDSDYGGMFSVSNCEIGTRRLSLTASVFRAICTNGCTFGQHLGSRLNRVHRGTIDLHKLSEEISSDINTQVPLLADGIDTFLKMQNKKLEVQPSTMIAQIARDFQLTPGAKGQAVGVATEYNHHEKQYRNLFGIVNAITRAAQLFSPEEHVRLENIAGELMNYDDSRWTNYNTRAKTLDKKEYDKVFGIVS